jgi:hypothetical protein
MRWVLGLASELHNLRQIARYSVVTLLQRLVTSNIEPALYDVAIKKDLVRRGMEPGSPTFKREYEFCMSILSHPEDHEKVFQGYELALRNSEKKMASFRRYILVLVVPMAMWKCALGLESECTPVELAVLDDLIPGLSSDPIYDGVFDITMLAIDAVVGPSSRIKCRSCFEPITKRTKPKAVGCRQCNHPRIRFCNTTCRREDAQQEYFGHAKGECRICK